MTLQELIDELNALRDEHGGEMRVVTKDSEYGDVFDISTPYAGEIAWENRGVVTGDIFPSIIFEY